MIKQHMKADKSAT